MASLHVSDLLDKANISASDSDDFNENEQQVEKEGKGVQLILKKNTTSKVWKYFGFIPSEDGSPSDSDTLRCRLCHKGVSAKWVNTINILSCIIRVNIKKLSVHSLLDHCRCLGRLILPAVAN